MPEWNTKRKIIPQQRHKLHNNGKGTRLKKKKKPHPKIKFDKAFTAEQKHQEVVVQSSDFKINANVTVSETFKGMSLNYFYSVKKVSAVCHVPAVKSKSQNQVRFQLTGWS